MTSTTLLGFVLGAGLASSLVLLVAAASGWRPQHQGHSANPNRGLSLGEGGWASRLGPHLGKRAAIAVAAAVPVAVLTHWPVLVGATVVLVWMWPAMFGASQVSALQVARLEAVATWTESMRDTIAGSIALEEAISNTAGAAPEVIQEPLQRLVGSLSVHVPLPQALAQFAEDFQDESIDLVAAALILNSRLRGPGLVATLTALASSAREELDMRRRIEEERKNLRRDARTIMLTAIGFAGVLAIFSRSYMAPYSTPAGQVVLAAVVAIFMAGLVWMRRLANVRSHERFLVGPETLARRARSTDRTDVLT
jgi:Flp pilus assembly protein TadB